MISTETMLVSNFLSVIGTTLTTNLTVTHQIQTGNLTIASNSIQSTCSQEEPQASTCSPTLYLQPQGGRLNLLAGVMTLDGSGTVTINGDLTINGTLASNQVSTSQITFDSPTANRQPPTASHQPPKPLIAAPNSDLEIKLATQSGLIIKTATDDPVTAISATGAATFNQLYLSAQSTGRATLLAGTKTAPVIAPNLRESSQVILTFESDYTPATKYWITKDFSTLTPQFIIHTDYPVAINTNASWLIIN
jgi:hypothetical protein